jgi:hypothetical protein
MQIAVAGGVRYVDGGWATITGALHERFRDLGGRVIAGRQVTAVEHAPAGVSIRTDDSIHDSAAAVLGVGGPSTAARLLGIDLPASWDFPQVQASCLDIWTTARPTGSLTFDLDRDLYLSVHAPVAQLAPVGVSVVSALHYLPVGEGPAKPAEEKAALLAHAARAGIAEAEILGQRYLHRMTVAHGFPLAEHRGVGPSVEVPGHPRVFVAGDWVDSDALLSDASAASAIEAAGAAVVAAGQPVGATRG